MLVIPTENQRVMNQFKLQAELETKEGPLNSYNKAFHGQVSEMMIQVITSHSVEEEEHKISKMNQIWVLELAQQYWVTRRI